LASNSIFVVKKGKGVISEKLIIEINGYKFKRVDSFQ
jgi:hypothetical protein